MYWNEVVKLSFTFYSLFSRILVSSPSSSQAYISYNFMTCYPLETMRWAKELFETCYLATAFLLRYMALYCDTKSLFPPKKFATCHTQIP